MLIAAIVLLSMFNKHRPVSPILIMRIVLKGLGDSSDRESCVGDEELVTKWACNILL